MQRGAQDAAIGGRVRPRGGSAARGAEAEAGATQEMAAGEGQRVEGFIRSHGLHGRASFRLLPEGTGVSWAVHDVRPGAR